MLPKSIASLILVTHYYFQGKKGPIYWVYFSRSERSSVVGVTVHHAKYFKFHNAKNKNANVQFPTETL